MRFGVAMAVDVTPARVLATAALCRLKLRDDEVEAFAVQIQAIVDAIATLDVLDATEQSTGSVRAGTCGLHEDTPMPSLARDVVLAQAPQQELGAFVVPRFVET
jgi:aspartyl-tRNA(Asn)/glutamyl-tRNA(Gln) amidotransferase subunit C